MTEKDKFKLFLEIYFSIKCNEDNWYFMEAVCEKFRKEISELTIEEIESLRNYQILLTWIKIMLSKKDSSWIKSEIEKMNNNNLKELAFEQLEELT